MGRISVVYNDAPVHCVDVANGIGERVMRIRPLADGGASIDSRGIVVVLNREDLADLVDALGKLRVG